MHLKTKSSTIDLHPNPKDKFSASKIKKYLHLYIIHYFTILYFYIIFITGKYERHMPSEQTQVNFIWKVNTLGKCKYFNRMFFIIVNFPKHKAYRDFLMNCRANIFYVNAFFTKLSYYV